MQKRIARTVVLGGALALGVAACSSSEGGKSSAAKHAPDAGEGTGGSVGAVMNGAGGAKSPGSGGAPLEGDAMTSAGGDGPEGGSAPPGNVPPRMGQVDAVFPKADVLPKLTNVVVGAREDSVTVDFDPVDGATDYRIFVLPEADTVSVDSGLVVVKDATYRCAGTRQGWDAINDKNMNDTTLSRAQGDYTFKTVIGDNPTLGNVYVTPGDGRTAVYAAAGYPSPPEYGWHETRLKVYTTDANERKALLDQGFRDDGVVFYVPAAGAGTSNVYGSSVTAGMQHKQYYFGEADKAAHDKDTVAPKFAFPVLTAPGADTVPLMAVTYNAANPHTELAAGKERFQRAAYQGNSPMWHLEWSGITEPVTLVVEALSSGCPFQGLLSATHLDASPPVEYAAHQAFLTVDDLRAASKTGEVFVNGQYDVTTNPKAIARSFVKVAPEPHAAGDWDWYQGFTVGTDLGAMTELATDPNKCWLCGRWKSGLFDIASYNIDHPNNIATLAFGTALGQMWLDFDDWAQDVTGKVRFTALDKAKIDTDPNRYLHATMSVDIVSTDRRYPQLIISDQDAPVQEGFSNPDNNSLIVQSIGGPSSRIEAQAIHGLFGTGAMPAPWDVNNQAPAHVFIDFDAYDNDGSHRPPTEAALEHSGVDRLTRFDVYVSTSRMYLLLDGTPAGCTRYPANFALKGAVTVTVGAVLYHEGADDEMVWHQAKPYGYWHRHEATETKRHFDDLAFKSGVAAPAWDEKRFPCVDY